MTCGIYAIINRESGKTYIGQSVDIAKRWREHRSQIGASDYPHGVASSTNAMWMDCHGPIDDIFEFVVLEEVENDPELLTVREQFYLNALLASVGQQGVYNANLNCVWPMRHSDASRAKMSVSKQGRLNPFARAVINLDTGERFAFAAEAGKSVNRAQVSISEAISRVGRCGGFRWAHAGDEIAQLARYALKNLTPVVSTPLPWPSQN